MSLIILRSTILQRQNRILFLGIDTFTHTMVMVIKF